MVAITTNLVDEVWSDRPPRPAGPLMVLPLHYTGQCTDEHGHHFMYVSMVTGRSLQEKVEDVRIEMAKKGADVLVITALDEVACRWCPDL